jgi:hypothetical protein
MGRDKGDDRERCPFPRCRGWALAPPSDALALSRQPYCACSVSPRHSWARCQHDKLWLNSYWNWWRDPCPCPDDPNAQRTVLKL